MTESEACAFEMMERDGENQVKSLELALYNAHSANDDKGYS